MRRARRRAAPTSLARRLGKDVLYSLMNRFCSCFGMLATCQRAVLHSALGAALLFGSGPLHACDCINSLCSEKLEVVRTGAFQTSDDRSILRACACTCVRFSITYLRFPSSLGASAVSERPFPHPAPYRSPFLGHAASPAAPGSLLAEFRQPLTAPDLLSPPCFRAPCGWRALHSNHRHYTPPQVAQTIQPLAV